MAFNPFHAFRKHQKVIFAILTILCMIVFIFQFGRGDVFERLLGRGGQQGKGEKVVTLYGRDVTSGDVDQIKQSRQIANEVILNALGTAEMKATKEVGDYKPDTPDPVDERLLQQRQEWSSRRFNMMFLNQQPLPADQLDRMLTFLRSQVRRDYGDLSDLANGLTAHQTDAAKAKTQAQIVADLRLLLRNQYYGMVRSQSPFYFGGGVKTEDLLDFDVWKHQADKLGVVMTKADARRALAHQAADIDQPKDPAGSWAADDVLKDVMAQHRDMTEDQIATAVADEFRVLIAKGLLDGPLAAVPALDADDRHPPAPPSTYDFWKYYRDNRTTIKAAFLHIPVDAFLSDVQKDIDAGNGYSEQELVELFDAYKSQVPNPALPTPGFKEPERIKVEYVTATGDTPYYKAYAAAAQFNLNRLFLTTPVGGNLLSGGVAPLAAMTGLLNYDLDLQSQLPPGAAAKAVQAGLLDNDALLTDYGAKMMAPIKTEIGDAGYLLGSGFGPLSAVSASAGALASAQGKDQTTYGRLVPAALLLAADGAFAGTPFAGLVEPVVSLPTPAPRDDLFRQALEKQQKAMTTSLLNTDVKDFSDALDKLKGDPDKAKDEIAKAVKERGWTLQDKAGLNDPYHIDEDPALKPLREALFHGIPPAPNALAAAVFNLPGASAPAARPGLYSVEGPLPVPGKDDAVIAYWRAADEHAHEMAYSQARPRVVDAWKLREARKRALERAAEINAEASKQASPAEAVKYLRDQKIGDKALGDVFELPEAGKLGIARIVSVPTPLGGNSAYQRYAIPDDKVPYAPDDLVDRLLGVDKAGKTLTFKDKPGRNVYVAVVEERSVPEFTDREKDKDFRSAYEDAAPLAPGLPAKDPLWTGFFLPDRQKEYQTGLMRALREEAAPGGLNEKGQFILSAKSQKQQQQQPLEPEPSEGPIGNDLGGL